MRNVILIGLIVALAAPPPAAASAAPAPAAPGVQGAPVDTPGGVVWTVAPDYEAAVTAAGKPLISYVFTSADFRRLLVVPVSGPAAYIFSLIPKSVATLPLEAVQDEGHRAVVAGTPEPSPAGAFAVQGAVISFSSGSVSIQITPEAPLSGEVPLEEILKRKPEYAASARVYQTDPAAMRVLKSWSQPVEIVVFFGTWCPVCRQRLPMLLKIMDEARNPNIHARFIAVDPDWKAPRQEIDRFKVRVTPTFILMNGPRELGRIEKKPPDSLEASLAAILTNG